MRRAGGLALALAVAACSHGAPATRAPRPPVTPSSFSPYEAAVLADRPTALFPLRDADGLRPKDRVADLAPGRAVATVVGGSITGTSAPGGERGALFLRGGRLVTSLTTGFASSDAFSIEMQVRSDACTTAWGRVLGTTDETVRGREGLEIIHFPSQFAQDPCRLGVEIWHEGRYVSGCRLPAVPKVGLWFSLALTYAKQRLACYDNGRLIATAALKPTATFRQAGPLGIGGSGSGFQGPADGISLSEVAIYDRALLAREIERHVRLLPLAAGPPVPQSS